MATNNSINNTDVPLAGGTMTGPLILSGDPTLARGAVTKQYADAIAAGVEVKDAVYAASTADLGSVLYSNGASGIGATLTNTGTLAAFTADGTTPAVNSRILVKNQVSTFQNGIYVLTVAGSGAVAWILTRSSDYNTAAQIVYGDLVPVVNGTINATTSWLQTATVTAIGSGNPITFVQFTNAPLTLPVAVTQGGTGVATLTTAYGTLCAGTTATGNVQTVSPGTTALPLVSGGASALPSYSGLTVPGGGSGVTSNTAYAVLCGGTSSTAAIQSIASVGSSGNVLTSNGAAALPTFQAAAAGGGGLTWIASVTASASASVNFDNKLTSTYDNYLIVMENMAPVTNGAYLRMQIGTGATPTYQTTGYFGQVTYTSTGAWSVKTTATTGFDLMENDGTQGMASTSTSANSGSILFTNVNNSSNYKGVYATINYIITTTALLVTNIGNFQWQNATVLTSIKFIMSSGNISTGTFKLYGYQN